MLKHRGKILRQAVDKFSNATGISISAVAKMVGYDQSTFYRHIDKEDLQLHILMRYGKAINHDFRQELPDVAEEFGMMVSEPPRPIYGKEPGITLSEAIEERDRWREKYYELLDIHNSYLREKIDQS